MSGSTLPAARTSPEWTQTMSLFPAGCPGSWLRFGPEPGLGVVGTGMIELHADGSLGALHRMPVGRRAVRWAALFSTPFYHSTVILDRTVLDEHGLRYDTYFDESEDFELWTRLLSVIDGDNIPDAMVLYRQHPGQASRRRA